MCLNRTLNFFKVKFRGRSVILVFERYFTEEHGGGGDGGCGCDGDCDEEVIESAGVL